MTFRSCLICKMSRYYTSCHKKYCQMSHYHKFRSLCCWYSTKKTVPYEIFKRNMQDIGLIQTHSIWALLLQVTGTVKPQNFAKISTTAQASLVKFSHANCCYTANYLSLLAYLSGLPATKMQSLFRKSRYFKLWSRTRIGNMCLPTFQITLTLQY